MGGKSPELSFGRFNINSNNELFAEPSATKIFHTSRANPTTLVFDQQDAWDDSHTL